MGLENPINYIYQFRFDKEDSENTQIIQNVGIYGLVICIKLNSKVSHTLYACLFSTNKVVPINTKQNKYHFYLDTYPNLITWSNKNENENRIYTV